MAVRASRCSNTRQARPPALFTRPVRRSAGPLLLSLCLMSNKPTVRPKYTRQGQTNYCLVGGRGGGGGGGGRDYCPSQIYHRQGKPIIALYGGGGTLGRQYYCPSQIYHRQGQTNYCLVIGGGGGGERHTHWEGNTTVLPKYTRQGQTNDCLVRAAHWEGNTTVRSKYTTDRGKPIIALYGEEWEGGGGEADWEGNTTVRSKYTRQGQTNDCLVRAAHWEGNTTVYSKYTTDRGKPITVLYDRGGHTGKAILLSVPNIPQTGVNQLLPSMGAHWEGNTTVRPKYTRRANQLLPWEGNPAILCK